MKEVKNMNEKKRTGEYGEVWLLEQVEMLMAAWNKRG